jgi:hypothetical protein
MNSNFGVELADDLAQNIVGGYNFGESSITNIKENLKIDKVILSQAFVLGKFAGAEGDATALVKIPQLKRLRLPTLAP